MAAANLYLDPQIRDWVLFPITLILVGVLRHYVTQLLDGTPKKQPILVVREQRALLRSQILRSSSALSPLAPSAYSALSSHLSTAFLTGTYLKVQPKRDANGLVVVEKSDVPVPPPNPLSDPSQMEGMMEGMKKQMVMMVPNFLIMGWINFFFSGFILIKLPFPLTLGFKSMLQRDIATPDMDVRWVSALSWYFLNLFGLNSLFRLLLSPPPLSSDNPHLASPNTTSSLSLLAGAAPSGSPPPPPDFQKFFEKELENLEFSEGAYRWAGEGVEERVRAKWGM
ncbi:integral membrane protein DUF106-domain-containing protein [Mrakia frigida]|uniref:ER membrane complex subunit EMC3 n=1 Tax=Mrakia frigida TaxID=29902 RepID=UPI003FCBF2AF